MPLTLTQKLRITPNTRLLTKNAPAGFPQLLGPLPSGVAISTKTPPAPDQIHWFVTNQAQMEKELPAVLNHLKPGVLCWIYYPKGSSGIQTDLTRDKGWEALLKRTDLQWLSLISFDATWSAFAMRTATSDDKKKPSKTGEHPGDHPADLPRNRPILDYIDATTKTVRLPDDLEKALSRNKQARVFYDNLSYTNRKEYVEWVVTARREETRKERVAGVIERLLKSWKNPRNM